jgi:hypothetical protein
MTTRHLIFGILSLTLTVSFAQADTLRQLQGSAIVCASHNDCPSNAYCDYLTNPYSCTPRACVGSHDCAGSTCEAGLCVVPGINGNNSTNYTCSWSGYFPQYCPVGFVCNLTTSECTLQPDNCTGDSQCGQGYFCNFNGQCQLLAKGDCFNNGDCSRPQECYRRGNFRWGGCLLRCCSHYQCGLTEFCFFDPFFHRCIEQPCTSNDDCYIGSNTTCQNGYCLP